MLSAADAASDAVKAQDRWRSLLRPPPVAEQLGIDLLDVVNRASVPPAGISST